MSPITGKRIKAAHHLMETIDCEPFSTVWVSVDRTKPALSNFIAPDHPECARTTTPR